MASEGVSQQVCTSFSINESWRIITVNKRNEHGQIRKAQENDAPIKFQYTEEIRTGDLYGTEGVEPDTSLLLREKALLISIFTPLLYLPSVMAANLFKAGIDTVSLKNLDVISKDLWAVCRAPIYAAAMTIASLYAMAFPYEGRALIGRVESQWHDGKSFRKNWSYGQGLCEVLKMERVIFLAPCMQKKGNINDKIGNKNKFVLI